MHRWVIPLSLGVLCGCAAGSLFDALAAPVLIGGAAGLLWHMAHPRMPSVVVVAVFCFGTALGAARVGQIVTAPEPLLSQAGTAVTVSGIVVSEPDIREASVRFVVLVEENETGVGRVLVSAPLHTPVYFGEQVTVHGRLTKPEAFVTDSGAQFQYDKWLQKDGICCTMAYPQIAHEGGSGRFAVRSALVRLKNSFVEAMAAALPEPQVSLGAGVLLGARHSLGTYLTDTFRTVGLSHIIVLSGYNMTVIAEALGKTRLLFTASIASALGAASIAAFAVLVGGGATVVRSALMALIAVIARTTGRMYGAPRALLVAGAAMALHSPLIVLYDPGFQLSFMATLSLIFGADRIEQKLSVIPIAFVRSVLASTIAAQIGVLPLLLYHIGSISLVSLVANLLVVPVVPVAMLLSFIAGIAGYFGSIIALIVGLPAYLLLTWILSVAIWLSFVPYAEITLPLMPWWAVVSMYGAMGYFWYHIRSTTNNAPL